MKFIYYIILATFLLIIGCSKKDNNSGIPLVSVNIVINAANPEFNKLNVVGGWIEIIGGSRGIIVYKSSNNEFRAYDRHCTYDPSSSCALVSVEVNNITGKDDCCGSKFLLTDGSVTQGPANLPLKQYQTSFDGQVLRIFN